MLVKLSSSTSGEVVMFAKHARRLFEIIGKECTASGVFTFEQLPAALARLYSAVDEEKLAAKLLANDERDGKAPPRPRYEERDARDDEGHGDAHLVDGQSGHHITLGQRAQPLIHLMEYTVRERGFILWEAAQDF